MIPVMRISGSMRVVLNAMIWPGMLVERASKKSVKISAADPDDGHVIKIYLIQVRYCGFSFHCNIFFLLICILDASDDALSHGT